MSPPPEYSYAHQGDGATSSPPADNSATAGKSPRQSRHQVDSPREPSFELAEECIDSPSGGLFYLINVALALGFYSDFTSPQNGRLALPLWDFLELLGERFLGPTFADDPLKRLLARLSHRQPSEDPGAEFTPPDSLDFERWLDRTELQVRDRLEIAIGIHGEAMTTLVFRQRAAVGVTATRVDITYRLVEHPIALRLAGLDRDPGWVPAGGRTIAFHYE